MRLLAAMSQRVRSSLTTAVVWLVAGAVAMTGLVWITVWAVAELRALIGGWAPLLIGLLLFVPIVIVALMQALRAPPPLEAPAAYERAAYPDRSAFSHPAEAPRRSRRLMTSDEPDEALDIGSAAMAFIQQSPLTAVALSAVAGLVLARSSGLLSRVLDLAGGARSD